MTDKALMASQPDGQISLVMERLAVLSKEQHELTLLLEDLQKKKRPLTASAPPQKIVVDPVTPEQHRCLSHAQR